MSAWLAVELTAVVFNLGFTICILWERRIGWLMGFVASCFSIALYLHNHALAMTGLNLFYAGMGLYGWWSWGRAEHDDRIVTRRMSFHVLMFIACAASTAALGWSLDRWAAAVHGYQEAFIFIFALAATWMMAIRLLENWIWWVIGDVVAVWFNHTIHLEWYALLNIAYIILSMAGLWRWSRAYRDQRALT